jgi:hypothetical protein
MNFALAPADDGDAHSVKVLQELPDLGIAGYVDHEVNLFHRQKFAVVPCDGNLKLFRECDAGGLRADVGRFLRFGPAGHSQRFL